MARARRERSLTAVRMRRDVNCTRFNAKISWNQIPHEIAQMMRASNDVAHLIPFSRKLLLRLIPSA
ncbi:hypothetical protein APX70_04957 [Pseudomonas syringae pv. maculicola]|uniref:Uncharacterized protein n=1 Tax=Pseudomonas syringae pv. maculicola TaxID=59511 RepID=A0A3M2ZQH2_PSEYM|nr:hypothetical protein APX70_04957 [Pseudomonas syringae pv. maculicola]